MRSSLVSLSVLAFTLFASGTQASARDWPLLRRLFRLPFQPVNTSVDVDQATQPVSANPDDGTPVPTPSLAPRRPTPRELATAPEYRSLSDEQKCALLGRERAHMVYPEDDDVDPYPVCRAWKWDDEDGWGWNWSELNCPWRQCPDCDDD